MKIFHKTETFPGTYIHVESAENVQVLEKYVHVQSTEDMQGRLFLVQSNINVQSTTNVHVNCTQPYKLVESADNEHVKLHFQQPYSRTDIHVESAENVQILHRYVHLKPTENAQERLQQMHSYMFVNIQSEKKVHIRSNRTKHENNVKSAVDNLHVISKLSRCHIYVKAAINLQVAI
jgi:hypothetical protein